MYIGHADTIKCPNNCYNPMENLAMQAQVRSQHETLNTWLKNWGILRTTYRQDITKHGMVFFAWCAVITQLAILDGEPLFKVEHSNQ